MSFIDKVRALVSTAPAAVMPPAVTGDGARPRASSAFMRGGRGLTFGKWRPFLREPQDDVSEAWDDAAARVTDLLHNSGWLAGAIEQAVANTVGSGLRLKAMPENTLFGMTEGEARKWALDVERRWGLYSKSPQECDVEGLRTVGQMEQEAFKSWLAMGESLIEHPWRKRPWNTSGSKFRILPPQRLSRRSEWSSRLVNGVYLDADGMPVAFRAVRKTLTLGLQEYDVRARDGLGRPIVTHTFSGPPGTYRGLSPLTPALLVARQFDQLADATQTAAILKTLFAATITSDQPTEEALAGLLTPQEQARMMGQGISPFEAFMDMQAGFYDDATIDLGINGRLTHLFPGQELKLHTSDHPGEDYKTYANLLLRELARCLGLTFEDATGDYTGATYSSVRMATGAVHKVTEMRRERVVAPVVQPVYENWLEEEIETGRVPFPGGLDAFLANRAAAARAEWRGSPKLQADDLGIAKAHEVWMRLGVVSPQMVAADLGHDLDDVYSQTAQAAQMRKDYGLAEPVLTAGGGSNDSSNPGGDKGKDLPGGPKESAD